MTLREIGENRLLAKILPARTYSKEVLTGPGDDCAVIRPTRESNLQLLKTDCVVEGVHFTKSTRAADIGWKAMARPLSDFAAMSGMPKFALLTMVLPAGTTLTWLKSLYRGLRKAAAAFDVEIVGGETSSTKGPAVIVVALTGEIEPGRQVLRSGGRLDDLVFVTGTLGGSLSGRHLRFIPRIAEARWLTENFRVHAMMDLSDGLGADLPRLAAASLVGYEIDETSIPRSRGCTLAQALNDGEDFELLFAVSPSIADELQTRWAERWPLRLTRIGRLTTPSKQSQHAPGGFDHFRKR